MDPPRKSTHTHTHTQGKYLSEYISVLFLYNKCRKCKVGIISYGSRSVLFSSSATNDDYNAHAFKDSRCYFFFFCVVRGTQASDLFPLLRTIKNKNKNPNRNASISTYTPFLSSYIAPFIWCRDTGIFV